MDLSTAEAIFGLEGSYTMDEIKAAYKRLAFEHHPDLNENSLESTNFMQQINEAHSILTQAARRGSVETPNRNEKPQQDGDGNSSAQRSTEKDAPLMGTPLGLGKKLRSESDASMSVKGRRKRSGKRQLKQKHERGNAAKKRKSANTSALARRRSMQRL